ncbi:enoyl-CoA hydratase/isomerase family protein [Roseomonas sp. E05]|uniref:enoyl-CoA hydratase/isomerase family protein n=1 Tax=Roseomonas sp. E05 TaxID=3046310 RepID=UPI0024BA79C5|nr:enoyl-CoA hydratase/isomerase family protein [Roseomonas sp. E05]MDJ0389585.1 enoyl-CoA hydratase/isomerase family protein [Roseomonas sp. E05]
MTEAVLWEMSAEGVATLTLNRPEARNALNTAMAEALLAGARRAVAEDARLVLVRASGPVFCAGADLKERKGMGEDQVRARRLKGFAAYDALERLPMPSIAVLQGPAVGSGGEIAAACDMIVATPAASFRTPEALWGTVGATQRLPRIIGKRLAKDMMFTGRTLSAEEARQAGLISRLVPDDAALEETLAEIARTILAAPAGALRQAKRCIDEGVERDPRAALATELMAIEENLAEGAWRAAMAGFGSPAR